MDEVITQTTAIETASTLSQQDEAYLCLVCLRSSTQRIAGLYLTYIQLRQKLSHEVPTVLFTVLLILQDKYAGLTETLESHYPEYMAVDKWHQPDEQSQQLALMTQESRDDLQQICTTEMKLLMLISEMMKQQ